MKDVRDREDDRGDREPRDRDERRESEARPAVEERKGMLSDYPDDDYI
jgi:hypothetical protein